MEKRVNLKVYKKTISVFLAFFMFTQVFAFNIPLLSKYVVPTAYAANSNQLYKNDLTSQYVQNINGDSDNSINTWVSDNGNGTYTNPIMWGDYPDNDVIRVGNDYYMVSTSMNMIPGCPIMKSKDLVNWEYCGYAVQSMSDPTYNFEGGDEYNEGPWATSLRYHNGVFYVLFNSNRTGAYVCTATDPAGPWTMTSLGVQLYDPGMFFDDDGRVYVVHGQGTLYLTELNADCKSVKTYKQQIHVCTSGYYCEGSRVYKRNGYYYILNTPTWSKGSKKEVAHRAKSLTGPFEEVDIMTSFMNWTGGGVHQGAIVDTPSGEWWSIIFQDRYPYGRVPTLQPVTWINDWPYMGLNNGTEAVVTYKKPNVGATYPIKVPATSDEFDSTKLGLQWQWNHNPDNNKWSLSERPGYMRLKTATITSNLQYARNTLTQRVQGPDSTAVIKMDTTNMENGDVAGLSLIETANNFIGVKKVNGVKSIILSDMGNEIASAAFTGNEIWFKAEVPKLSVKTNYYYSTDGINFTQLGDPLEIHQSGYVGIRFGIFNYATSALGGYVDIDWYHFNSKDHYGNLFTVGQTIEAERYDDKWGCSFEWAKDRIINGKDQDICSITNNAWLKFDQIDFGSGATSFDARVASGASGGSIEIRLDSPTGTLIGTCTVTGTGGWQNWMIKSCSLSGVTGKQRVYLVFKGGSGNLFNLNWFRFNSGAPDIPSVPTGLTAKTASTSQINVTWDEPAEATGFDLMIDGTTVSDVPNPYFHTGLEGGSTHTYQVRAKNSAGTSEWSLPVNATTQPAGTRNLALNKIATADSQQSGNTANKGNDGNTSTRWCANDGGLNHWWKVDLGEVSSLSGSEVTWESAACYKYKIEVSSDNTNWVTVADKTKNLSTQQVQDDSFTAKARYVRVTVTGLQSGMWASFYEFKAYGVAEGDSQDPNKIPQEQMTVTATSEEILGENGVASNVLDGNAGTFWHTKWWPAPDSLPQSLTINLGGKYKINQLRYLPRQNSNNGRITSYKTYVSIDGISFTEVDMGIWQNDNQEKTSSFNPVNACYVKLEAIEGFGGYASAAEINVYKEPEAVITSINPVNVTVEAGMAPVLPAKVTAEYSDKSSKDVDVTWDDIDASKYAEAGSFTVNGTVNGTTIKAVANVTVNKATPTVTTWPTATDIIYGQTLAASTINSDGITSVPGTFIFNDTTIAPSTGTQSFDVIFTPTDSANYNTVYGKINVTTVYQYSDVLEPINADGTSLFKTGSTVPVKFTLKDYSGAYVSTASATISYAKLTDNGFGTDVKAISTSAAATGNAFRYDSTSNQYIFNISTRGLTPGTYRLTITLDDGNSYPVQINLR